MRSSKKLIEKLARNLGLFVRTWSPGDGVRRYYRIFPDDVDYFAGGEYVTCLGAREAHTWLDGYAVAHWRHHGKK